jgi:hypothetical protein
MEKIKFHLQNQNQRIATSDMNKTSEFYANNESSYLTALLGVNNIVVRNGLFSPVSGMVIKLDADSFICQQKTNNLIIPAVSENEIEVTVPTSDPTNPRIDVIKAKIERVAEIEEPRDTINGLTGDISSVNVNTQKNFVLTLGYEEGTPAGSPSAPVLDQGITAGNFITDGNQGEERDLSSTIDLSTLYNIKVRVDAGSWTTIDLRGATPGATSLSEIVSAINTALGDTYASIHLSKYLKITSILTDLTGKVEFSKPTSNDATNLVLGLLEEGNYYYKYESETEWFKLAEIDVPAGATSITSNEIKSADRFDEWDDQTVSIEIKSVNTFDEINVNKINEKTEDNGVDIESVNIKNGKLSSRFIKTGIRIIGKQGNELSLGGQGSSTIGSLSNKRIVLNSTLNDFQKIYEWDNLNWAQVGNTYSWNAGNYSYAALTTSRWVLTTVVNSIYLFDFDETNINLINTFTYDNGRGGAGGPRTSGVCAVSETRIVIINQGNELIVYDINDSSLTQVGSKLQIAAEGAQLHNSVALLSKNSNSFTVSVFLDDYQTIEAYKFENNSWTKVGNTLNPNLSVKTKIRLDNIGENRVLASNRTMSVIYDFNQTDFIETTRYPLTGIGFSSGIVSQAVLSDKCFVFHEDISYKLTTIYGISESENREVPELKI